MQVPQGLPALVLTPHGDPSRHREVFLIYGADRIPKVEEEQRPWGAGAHARAGRPRHAALNPDNISRTRN